MCPDWLTGHILTVSLIQRSSLHVCQILSAFNKENDFFMLNDAINTYSQKQDPNTQIGVDMQIKTKITSKQWSCHVTGILHADKTLFSKFR